MYQSSRSDLSRRRLLSFAGAAATAWLAKPAAARGEAGSKWVDRGVYGPFHCLAEFPLAPWAATFEELARLQLQLQRTLGLPPDAPPTDVYLLADEKNHQRCLESRYPGLPYRRALYVKHSGRGAVYAYCHEQLAVDLRHECTHALLHGAADTPPLWLDEGIAEYFEMPEAERPSGHPHLAALRWHLRLGVHRSLKSLESVTDLANMGSIEYRFAWAWVHFMLHGPRAAHRSLVEYLASLRGVGKPFELSRRLHAAAPNLDECMVRHFTNWKRA